MESSLLLYLFLFFIFYSVVKDTKTNELSVSTMVFKVQAWVRNVTLHEHIISEFLGPISCNIFS